MMRLPFLLPAALGLLLLTPRGGLAVESAPQAADAPAADVATAPVREAEWYTAEVPVSSQEARERQAALGRALAQVMVRVTGRPDAPANDVVQKALRVADTLLLGSEYREAETLVGGVPTFRQKLAASFDPEAVDALVMAAGLPLWSGARPRPLLWLAIDDGGGAGPRLVSAQQINVVKPLAERGLERGIRVLLPAGNPVEQQGAAAVWRLDPAAVGVLSARYGAPVQLLGRMSRAGTGWSAEWVLAQGAEELQRWTFSDPSPQRVIASGADEAANALGKRQARWTEVGKPEQLEAEVSGLGSGDAWLGLAAYLQRLPVLRGYDVLEASPDRVVLRLDLAVDRARFEAMLVGGNMLAVESVSTAGDPPVAPTETSTRARYRLQR